MTFDEVIEFDDNKYQANLEDHEFEAVDELDGKGGLG